jgi:hypothetical protein
MAERLDTRVSTASYQAYQLLYVAFTIAPIIAGLDKFGHVLVDWDKYLSPIVARTLPVSPHAFMLGVGVVEVVAGALVALAPEIGGAVVGLWLCGIIVNLLSIPAYFDIALRDLGLALGAFALSRLASDYRPTLSGRS